MKLTHSYQMVALAVVALVAGSAQGSDLSNGLIVRFASGTSKKEIKSILKSDSIQVSKDLVPGAGIYLITSSDSNALKGLDQSLKSASEIIYSQPNHMLSLRRNPNDPRYAEQWNMKNTTKEGADLHAEEAWELGVGGRDRAGHEVVVAVIDGGIDYTHEDLAENMWTNTNEIAGNGIDDDGNGYVDDVVGWNASGHNGQVESDDHGTHVAGIMGAKGDNGKHVTGVNWNIKVMPISVGWFSTAAVLEAYGYVLAQKKLWLKTEGRLGANVVATNSSFGYDYADCTTGEFPAWNDIYNQMGEFGILSSAATINNNTNVDVEGDVPTACSSEFIVAVTNTNKQDMKYTHAGYGAKNIDLGAPGTDILSTVPGNGARTMTGTSMAAPHVAGAIGFVHSVASESFYKYYVESPSDAALSLKAMLLSTTDALPSLQGVTVSGGRLNLAKAGRAISKFEQESAKSLADLFDLTGILGASL